MLLVDSDDIINKKNARKVNEILSPVFYTDMDIIIDGVSERKTRALKAKKELEEIGETIVIEKYLAVTLRGV